MISAPKSMRPETAILAGYAIISRAHLIAARLDRGKWQETMAAAHLDGMDWVDTLGPRAAADHYRRCHTTDKIKVPAAWIGLLPNSGNGPIKFQRRHHAKPKKIQ